jgi:hypothetical protein
MSRCAASPWRNRPALASAHDTDSHPLPRTPWRPPARAETDPQARRAEVGAEVRVLERPRLAIEGVEQRLDEAP